mmetsp:Transcript_98151/g.282314  ORF Transcript_98151/g.282314 Transcript_98151/m.282314 type:complete len:443 (-) Transcript_98151:983-2311(-)
MEVLLRHLLGWRSGRDAQYDIGQHRGVEQLHKARSDEAVAGARCKLQLPQVLGACEPEQGAERAGNQACEELRCGVGHGVSPRLCRPTAACNDRKCDGWVEVPAGQAAEGVGHRDQSRASRPRDGLRGRHQVHPVGEHEREDAEKLANASRDQGWHIVLELCVRKPFVPSQRNIKSRGEQPTQHLHCCPEKAPMQSEVHEVHSDSDGRVQARPGNTSNRMAGSDDHEADTQGVELVGVVPRVVPLRHGAAEVDEAKHGGVQDLHSRGGAEAEGRDCPHVGTPWRERRAQGRPGNHGASELRRPIPVDLAPWYGARDAESEGHRGVQMAAGDGVADVHHRQKHASDGGVAPDPNADRHATPRREHEHQGAAGFAQQARRVRGRHRADLARVGPTEGRGCGVSAEQLHQDEAEQVHVRGAGRRPGAHAREGGDACAYGRVQHTA